MKSITTVTGDTWDMIAYRVYGDVLRAQELMEARENARLLDIQVFSAGTTVYTPDITGDGTRADLPAWRR